eukprot:TRINITY_DN14749_c0_g1_i1.p1 TRINITY_DN14749_c0_g1~~TRINITY_DN14749_c0_g1_i1.p1  ORF type:complete len:262 (+),score=74.56 TRINITY_DN14749_c0_g1_i1:125-910(+)
MLRSLVGSEMCIRDSTMPVDLHGCFLLQSILETFKVVDQLHRPSKLVFLTIGLLGVVTLILIFIMLVRATDAIDLALGALAFVLGIVQLFISLKNSRSYAKPIDAVKEHFNTLKETLVTERGVDKEMFDVDPASAEDPKFETPTMQQVSLWFEKREKLGENAKEIKEQTARDIAMSPKHSQDLGEGLTDVDLEQGSIGSDEPTTTKQRKGRHSKNRSSGPRGGSRSAIESVKEMSPLSPRGERTKGKGDGFKKSELSLIHI